MNLYGPDLCKALFDGMKHCGIGIAMASRVTGMKRKTLADWKKSYDQGPCDIYPRQRDTVEKVNTFVARLIVLCKQGKLPVKKRVWDYKAKEYKQSTKLRGEHEQLMLQEMLVSVSLVDLQVSPYETDLSQSAPESVETDAEPQPESPEGQT